jgi:hypothetical protein
MVWKILNTGKSLIRDVMSFNLLATLAPDGATI